MLRWVGANPPISAVWPPNHVLPRANLRFLDTWDAFGPLGGWSNVDQGHDSLDHPFLHKVGGYLQWSMIPLIATQSPTYLRVCGIMPCKDILWESKLCQVFMPPHAHSLGPLELHALRSTPISKTALPRPRQCMLHTLSYP